MNHGTGFIGEMQRLTALLESADNFNLANLRQEVRSILDRTTMTSTPRSTAPSEGKISAIVASSSRTVAPTLPEMQALLTQWAALTAQEKMTGEWPRQLALALDLLPKAGSVAQLVQRLQQQGA